MCLNALAGQWLLVQRDGSVLGVHWCSQQGGKGDQQSTGKSGQVEGRLKSKEVFSNV